MADLIQLSLGMDLLNFYYFHNNFDMKKEIEENIHYYLENGKVVFTEVFHIERGSCCGNKCKHCPYDPKWEKENKILLENK